MPSIFLSLRNWSADLWIWGCKHAAVYVKNQINLLPFLSLSACLPAFRTKQHSPKPEQAPRIPIAALTSRVCAFGAAGLRRSLQGSFTWVRGIGLHVWLLIVMVRIWENPVLLYCSAGHHFRACSWMLGLRLRLNPPFSRLFFFSYAAQPWRWVLGWRRKRFRNWKIRLFLTDGGRLAARFSVVRRAYRDAAQGQKEKKRWSGGWSAQRGGKDPRPLQMENDLGY